MANSMKQKPVEVLKQLAKGKSKRASAAKRELERRSKGQ